MTQRLPRRALLLAPSAAALLCGTALLVLRPKLSEPPPVPLPGGANPLLGHKLPPFALPGLDGRQGFTSGDVVRAGRPVLVNVFASWCGPCRLEAPVLAQLARRGLAVWGIDYQDHPTDAATFLRDSGDPYQRIGSDPSGAAGRALAITGVPESFLVRNGGIVRWHWAGGLSEDVVRNYLDPALLRES
jgi:cytochrome c biogenesis protein CcmG, thiol:disulfide interchange protein DsbE